MECNLTTETETDKHFDDAFIEDLDLNTTILDNSREATIDKSIKYAPNSCVANKEKIEPDCQKMLHWPQENLSSSQNFCIWEISGVTPKSVDKNCIWETAHVTPTKSIERNCIWETAGVTPTKSTERNCVWKTAGITPMSTERDCIWETAGVTPMSTDKMVCKSVKQAILMDYSTAAMSRPGSTETPSTISTAPKNCTVKVTDTLLADVNSPSKNTASFSSSLRPLAFEKVVSCNVSQSQPLKDALRAQNDLANTDNQSRRERGRKKHSQAGTRSVKKREWKQKDVPRKKNCLNSSITIVLPVSLEDCPSTILLDSKEDPIMDKSVLLTSVPLQNSSPVSGSPFNSAVEANNGIENTDNWVKSTRNLESVSESVKTAKKWTKRVHRKRKHMGQLVEESFALGRFLSENESGVVDKLTLCSNEAVCPSPGKHKSIQTNDLSDDARRWTALPTSDENVQLIISNLAFSNRDAEKQNNSWNTYSGDELFSLKHCNNVLANKATEPCNDENAVLAYELKNWEPFSASAPSKTVGAMREDTEMDLQETIASDANLSRTQLLSDQFKDSNKKKKNNRRKSMSADREIASQMVVMASPEISDCSLPFPHKRYPQRLRRRSTELLQFTQIEPFWTVDEVPVTAPYEESLPRSGELTAAGNEIVQHDDFTSAEMQVGSELLANVDNETKLGFENTARSGDDLDFDASMLDSEFNLLPATARCSRRLRRTSTELFRISKNAQNQPVMEDMPEEQESTSSQKAQNDIVSVESKGKQNGMNKSSRGSKKKQGKEEQGPPLEDIYLNRLWRSQMPKDTLWETIPEDPKHNKETGGLRFFSARKAKRFLNFDEGPSLSHLKKRKLKAMKNGWKPIPKKKGIALTNLLEQKLSQLDAEIGVV